MSNPLVAAAMGLCAVVALALLFGAVSAINKEVRERLRWTRALRAVIRTDSRMLGDAFRLSHAHFQALNELRKLGGRR